MAKILPMFTKVEVTFTNKDNVEETAHGILLAWYYDGDGYLICYIVLNNGRFVTTSSEESYTAVYKEMTESFVQAESYNPYFKISYNPFKDKSNLKVLDKSGENK